MTMGMVGTSLRRSGIRCLNALWSLGCFPFPADLLESVKGGDDVAFVRLFVFVVEVVVFARCMSLKLVAKRESSAIYKVGLLNKFPRT